MSLSKLDEALISIKCAEDIVKKAASNGFVPEVKIVKYLESAKNSITQEQQNDNIFKFIRKWCEKCIASDKYEDGECACQEDGFFSYNSAKLRKCSREMCPILKDYEINWRDK